MRQRLSHQQRPALAGPPAQVGRALKLVLIGDGEQAALLAWARQLAPRVRLSVVSSQGFGPGWELLLPDADRLALNVAPGNPMALLKQLPRVGAWLAATDADWLHAHDLTLHGNLAWAARLGWRLRAQIAGSAAGPDILNTPERGASWRWLTRKTLRSCVLTTAESDAVAERMRALGAAEVMSLPAASASAARLFEPHVQRFLTRLRELSPPSA